MIVDRAASNFTPRENGFVHHSIAILYHEVPNPNITIRNFGIAVGGGGGGGAQQRAAGGAAGGRGGAVDRPVAVRDGERHTRWSRGGRAGEGSPIDSTRVTTQYRETVWCIWSVTENATPAGRAAAAQVRVPRFNSSHSSREAVSLCAHVAAVSNPALHCAWGLQALPALGLLQASRSSSRQCLLWGMSPVRANATKRGDGVREVRRVCGRLVCVGEARAGGKCRIQRISP
jgi:hypothetical protein